MSPSLGTFFLFDHLKINGYIQEIIYIILLHNMAALTMESKCHIRGSLPPTQRGTRKEEENGRVPSKHPPDWALFGELPQKGKILLPKFGVPTRRPDGAQAIFVDIQFSTHILLVENLTESG